MACAGALQKHVFISPHDTMLGRALVSRSLAVRTMHSYMSTWITSVVTIKLSYMFTHCINTKRVPVECVVPPLYTLAGLSPTMCC